MASSFSKEGSRSSEGVERVELGGIIFSGLIGRLADMGLGIAPQGRSQREEDHHSQTQMPAALRKSSVNDSLVGLMAFLGSAVSRSCCDRKESILEGVFAREYAVNTKIGGAGTL
jgi:hypothetical protein